MNATTETIAPDSAPSLADGPISRVINIPPAPVAAPEPDDVPVPLFQLPQRDREQLTKCLTEASSRVRGSIPSNLGPLIERLRLFAGEIEGGRAGAGLTIAEKRRQDIAKALGPLKLQIQHLEATLKQLCDGKEGHGQRMSVTDFFRAWEHERWDLTYAPPSWHLVIGHIGRVRKDWLAGAIPDDAVVHAKLRWAINELRRHRREDRDRRAEFTAIITSETRNSFHTAECECARCNVVSATMLQKDPYTKYRRALGKVGQHGELLREHYGDYGLAWQALALKYKQIGSLFWLTEAGRIVFREAMDGRKLRGQPAWGGNARDWFQAECFSKGSDVAKLIEKKKPEQRSVLDQRTRIERARTVLEKQAKAMLAAADAALFDVLERDGRT